MTVKLSFVSNAAKRGLDELVDGLVSVGASRDGVLSENSDGRPAPQFAIVPI